MFRGCFQFYLVLASTLSRLGGGHGVGRKYSIAAWLIDEQMKPGYRCRTTAVYSKKLIHLWVLRGRGISWRTCLWFSSLTAIVQRPYLHPQNAPEKKKNTCRHCILEGSQGYRLALALIKYMWHRGFSQSRKCSTNSELSVAISLGARHDAG